jgi:hypothetical protein
MERCLACEADARSVYPGGFRGWKEFSLGCSPRAFAMLNLIRRRRLSRRFLVYTGKVGAIGVLLGIISVGAVGKERLSTLAPGTLPIGTYFVNPPFEYISKGARVGFEVDLMNDDRAPAGVGASVR